jgi:hypothetical protein
MQAWIKVLVGVGLLCGSTMAGASGAWSTQDYDLYPGDFNGDGLTDMLYIAKDPSHVSGIVLSDGTGLNTTLQTWGNAYLGVPWSSGQYTIIVADFDGDGKADILLQRKTPGDHYLLLTEAGGVGAISQTIAQNTAGIAWSADQHRIVAGDFNGDGKVDLFFQAPDPKGLNAVVLADGNGQFSSAVPDQSWADGYAGLNWASTEAHVYSADFNGDGRGDLLVQALPIPGTGPGTNLPAQFVPNMNGVVLAQAAKKLFTADTLQAWSRNGFGADWSPLSTTVVTGDFNGDGKADVLLQGQTAVDSSYLLYGRTPGAIFAAATSLGASGTRSADTSQMLVGQYLQGKGQSVYAQARVAGQNNALARVGSGGFAVALADASLPQTASAGALSTGLRTAAAGGPIAPALLAATSAGRTAGQFAVSAMGAATYQIPIWTPPGARGLEPHLAITYASGSPDGMMGPGWNVSGLSSISRCNKTYAENGGSPAAVTLTTSDDFCIDGNRLRVTSGTYGAAGSQYMTEIATFSRATSYGTAGNGPSYFIVEGKDGLYYEYGNTADSKAYASGGSTPYSWMLNKVRDRQGNNLIVVYATTSGSVAPSTIQYTQTPSTNGTKYPYTVSFTYQARVTNLSRYVAGGNVQQTQVLAKINVQSSGVSVRQYNMTYATAPTTVRDRLTAIQECGGSVGTDCLRATTVAYQDGAQGIANPTVATGSGVTAGVLDDFFMSADVDGDGRDDLVFPITSGSNMQWYVQFATASGFSAPVPTGASTPSNWVIYGTSDVLLDDFLGEGKNSILAPNGSVYYMYRWNGTAFVATSVGVTVSGAYASADVNGDGRADLVRADFSTGNIYLRANTTQGTTVSFAASEVLTNTLTPGPYSRLYGNNVLGRTNVKHMDFDGDGRDDLLYEASSTSIWSGTYTQATGLLSRGTTFVAGPTLLVTATKSVAPVRWNDDACTDLQADTTIQIAACNGSYATNIALPATATIFADWDGDGRTDAIAYVSGTWTVYRSLGTAVSTGVAAGWNVSGQPTVFNSDGDGEDDIAFATGTGIYVGSHNGASTPADLITSISDGWGISASPTYVPITQDNYFKDTRAVYPESDIQAPMYVVNNVSQSDGIGGAFSNSFWYYTARVNRQGRGFEGFGATRSQDSRTGVYQFVYYNLAYPYTGTVYQRIDIQPDSTYTRKTNNTFAVTDLSGAGCALTVISAATRCFPYLQEAITKSGELGSGTTPFQTSDSTFTYDIYGNLLTASTTTRDNDTASPNYNLAWTSLVTNTYGSVNTSTWCLDKPTHTTTQNTVPGQAAQTRTVDHGVDTTNCRFTSETVEPSSSLTAVTNFGYDSCGNVNSVGVVGLDQNGATMPTRTTTSSYGTRCTFPESVTNALTQTAYTSYNYSYGVKASSADPNSVSVSWLYDNFGRKVRESRPDSTYTTIAYTDCTADPCWGVANLRFLAQATQYDSGSTLIRTVDDFYDGFERPRYHEYNRALGVDQRGHVLRQPRAQE